MLRFSMLGRNLVVLSMIGALSGCVANKAQLVDLNQQMRTGSYEAAAENAIQNGKIQEDGTSKDLLWSLQAGSMLTLTGDYKRSNLIYDFAETLMQGEDTEGVVKSGFENVTAALYNNSINGYTPTVYDSVMVNTYKGLNFVLQKDWQNARIEFNRASDRQRRAEEHFKKKIEEEQEKLAKEQEKKEENVVVTKDDARKTIDEKFSEMNEWQTYGNYINPYTDYLHGLFFMLTGVGNSDYEKAVFSFNRVTGMNGKNSVIDKDLQFAKKLQSGAWKRENVRPQVWVIFENGLAPMTEEIVIPVPLFLVTDEIGYSQIALPKLVEQPNAYPALEVYADGKKLGTTERIASMERVIRSEFKKEYPMRVTKAIVSAVAKGAVTHVAQEQFGLMGNVLGSLYAGATTHADTRSWSSLPKEVQALRVRKPAGNSLTINAPGIPQPIQVDLPESRYSMVYVKALGENSQPAYQVVGFDS